MKAIKHEHCGIMATQPIVFELPFQHWNRNIIMTIFTILKTL